jgi:hypothetical protein
MKSRKLGIALLLMLALVVTSGTFAYWATSVTGPSNDATTGTVTVGSGDVVTTSFSLTGDPATGGDLVPAGLAGTGEVESVDLTYGFQWVEDADSTTSLADTTTTGNLNVTYTITVIAADGTTDVTSSVGSLVNVSASASYPLSVTLGAAAQNLSWTVTLDEPTTQAQYNDIQNATITIDFTWSIDGVSTN